MTRLERLTMENTLAYFASSALKNIPNKLLFVIRMPLKDSCEEGLRNSPLDQALGLAHIY
jgi:hypothetical protein